MTIRVFAYALALCAMSAAADGPQDAYARCTDKVKLKEQTLQGKNTVKAQGDKQQLDYLNQVSASELNLLRSSCNMWRAECEKNPDGDACAFFQSADN
jgi:hypothetical protein